MQIYIYKIYIFSLALSTEERVHKELVGSNMDMSNKGAPPLSQPQSTSEISLLFEAASFLHTKWEPSSQAEAAAVSGK